MADQDSNPSHSKQEKTWGMLVHLVALIGFLGVPFGHLLGPLVVWLIFRKEYPYVDAQGKEALNFQITLTLAALLAAILIIVLIGIPLLFLLVAADVILVIIATVKVSNGDDFKYPWTLRLIK